jgi:hypothetical protein
MKGQKSVSTMSDYQEVDGMYFPVFNEHDGTRNEEIKKGILNLQLILYAFPAQ